MTFVWRVRLARIALGWAALASLGLASSIPWRDPRPAELVDVLAWLALAVASIVGVFTLRSRRSFGRWLVVFLGVYGTARLVIVLRSVAALQSEEPGPGVVAALLIVSSLFVVLMLAALLTMSMREHWLSMRETPTSAQSF